MLGDTPADRVPDKDPIESPKPDANMLDTALETIKPVSSQSFETTFLASRSKIQQLVREIFAELRKYLLLRQNMQAMDIDDVDQVKEQLRKITSRFEILSDILAAVEKYLTLRAVDKRPGNDLLQDLEYLVDSIEHTIVETISIEGAENLNNNLRRLEGIYTTVVDRIYDAISTISPDTENDISKYCDILVCLSKEVIEILTQSGDVIKRMSDYDPYKVKQMTATNTQANRTQTIINTARRMVTKEDHFQVEEIHFNRDLGMEVFEYVQPPLHRLYISEAAKAYAEIAAIKLSKIVLEEEFEDKPQILTTGFFNEQCENAVLHYCKPNSKEMVIYNLVDIFDALSITKEFQHVREISMNFQFSAETRSIIAPSGKIFITNGKMKPNQDDLSFFEYNVDGSLKARPNLLVSKREHAMVHLNGFIYIVGGRTLAKKCTASCHRYDIKKKLWTQIASTAYAIRKATLSILNSRYIFRFGGLNEFDYIDKNIEVYDSLNDGWTPVRTSSKLITQQTEVLFNSFAVPINQNTIYVFGGDNMNNFQTDTGYTFTIVDVKERKRKPSKVEGLLRSLKQAKRSIFSYGGRFVESSALVYKGSIYFLRQKYY